MMLRVLLTPIASGRFDVIRGVLAWLDAADRQETELDDRENARCNERRRKAISKLTIRREIGRERRQND